MNRLLNQSLAGVVSFAENGAGVARRDAAADLPGQCSHCHSVHHMPDSKLSDAAVILPHSLWKSPSQLNRKFQPC